MTNEKLEVLFGNDERGIRESVKIMIEEYGLAVDLNENPQDYKEVIEMARKKKYFAIITDLNYNDACFGEGYKVIEEIRRFDKTTPIILATNQYNEKIAEKGKSYGATEVIDSLDINGLTKLLENLKTK